jgi:hypothetical protein
MPQRECQTIFLITLIISKQFTVESADPDAKYSPPFGDQEQALMLSSWPPKYFDVVALASHTLNDPSSDPEHTIFGFSV